MTVDEAAAGSDADEGRRTVLVGVQLDGSGRELLDWALSRVAQQGDRVIAVHVCRSCCGSCPLSLIKSLDKYLEEYEGLCNLTQVALVGRVSRGNSIRRTLVKEAKLCSAAAVVVGVNKGTPFGGTISVARYCAKKLPPTTSLVAVHDGKVILEREASMPPPEGEPKTTHASMRHTSFHTDAMAAPTATEARSEQDASRDSDAESLRHDPRRQEADESDAPSPSYWRRPEAEPGSVTLLVRKLPEPTRGWPLLRRVVLPSPGPPPRGNDPARNMSVVQWVMNLPSRSLPPEASPDGTPSPSAQGSPSAPVGLREELEAVLEKNSSSCRWFSHVELQNYTDQFSSENLIGKGGSSRVYRGCLPDGQRVAVKIARLTAEAARDFLSEVDIITSLQHRNVVSLVGISVEDYVKTNDYSDGQSDAQRSLTRTTRRKEREEGSITQDNNTRIYVVRRDSVSSYIHGRRRQRNFTRCGEITKKSTPQPGGTNPHCKTLSNSHPPRPARSFSKMPLGLSPWDDETRRRGSPFIVRKRPSVPLPLWRETGLL